MNNTLSREIFSEQTKHLSNRLLLSTRGWALNVIEYPTVDVTFAKLGRVPLRVRLICSNWDEMPPSVELLNSEGEYLKALPRSGTSFLNQGPHPKTGRPFICSPGCEEYHIHPSHITDNWENYKSKSSYDIGGILTQIWRAWLKSND